MPELPEVQTIKTQLTTHLPLEVLKTTISKGLTKNILHTKLAINNLTITRIDRKGKMLIFYFDKGDKIMLSHLGMTGRWLIKDKIERNKHYHLIIETPKCYLIYEDPRRFGHLYFFDDLKKAQEKINSTGMDIGDDSFDLIHLKKQIQRYPMRALKVSLLDQKLFAGSGNYIANEICARAKILPTRLCKDIKPSEYQKIHLAIGDVLRPAIKSGGTTFQGGYLDTTGNKGMGVNNLVVFYQKICQQCLKTEVTKIILAGRGTYFCSRCQK